MFNLPTGTILINVWIKVGRLRLYLHQPSLLSLHQTGSDSTQPLPDHHNHHRKSTCRYDACPVPMYLRTEHKLFCIRLLNPTDKLRTAGFAGDLQITLLRIIGLQLAFGGCFGNFPSSQLLWYIQHRSICGNIGSFGIAIDRDVCVFTTVNACGNAKSDELQLPVPSAAAGNVKAPANLKL